MQFLSWVFYSRVMDDKVADKNALLQEIRDLLIPISAIARAHLTEEGPDRLRVVVGSGQRLKAASLMDGSNNRAKIQKMAGISAANLSTLLKELREAGLVTERESQPRLLVGPSGVWKK